MWLYSSITLVPSNNTHSIVTRSKIGVYKPRVLAAISIDLSFSELTNVKQAHSHPGWKKFMQDEFDALLRNKTWVLISP